MREQLSQLISETSTTPGYCSQEAMAPIPVAQRKNEILKLLYDDQIKTIVLHGKAGVGKTWTAREASDVARQKCYIVLWAYLSRKYDYSSLLDSISQQLCLLPTPGEFEVDEPEKEDLPKLIQSRFSKKKLLLVLDDEGNAMNEADIMPILDSVLKLQYHNYKLIITTKFLGDAHYANSGRTYYLVDRLKRGESMLLLTKRACTDGKLLDITVAKKLIQRTEDIPSKIILMAKAFKYFSEKGPGVPLTCFLEKLSNRKACTLTDLLRSGYNLVPTSILNDCQRDYKDKPFLSDSRCIHYNELIVYWMMEGYLGHVTCMEETFKKGYQIFMELVDFQVLKRVEANYVTISPLAEEFDYFLSQRESDDYHRGYHAYARLGLDTVFANYNNWSGQVSISHTGGVAGTNYGGKQKQPISVLVLDGNALTKYLPGEILKARKELQGLGIFNPSLDLLFSFSSFIHELHVLVLRSFRYLEDIHQLSTTNFKNLTVLEISGPSDSSGKDVSSSRSFVEIPHSFFKMMPKLQSLNLSSLQIKFLPSSLYNLDELKWLVLRDCTSLKSLDSLRNCVNLEVLDCSGSTSLKNIDDRCFENVKLQSLNLSSLPLTELDLSHYKLSELKWLILRDCISLTFLGSLKGCKSLMVLDCSGSTSFEHFEDRTFANADLEMINLTGTKIKTLPRFVNQNKLTHLLLSNCLVKRMWSIRNMASLEVIDLSNAGNFCEFFDKSLKKLVNLQVFDLSGTGLSVLPGNIGNPRHLSLKNCTQLRGEGVLESLAEVTNLEHFVLSDSGIRFLPPISHLSNLQKLSVTCCLDLETVPDLRSLENMEELDFSGCKCIKSIPDNTFDKMSCLKKLNLSGTGIISLPSLANLSNLCLLLLNDCAELKSLPSLESKSLGKLEELNVSGCKALRNIDANFLDGAVNLHIVDLSNNSLVKLPSFSKLGNLCELYLRNCKDLESVPDLGNLINLEILDLSGSAVSSLPLLSNLVKLRHLLLKNCSSLSSFLRMGTLSVLGDSFQNLPYGISELTSLERLDLPEMDYVPGASRRELTGNGSGSEWGISSLSAPMGKRPFVSVTGSQFLQPLEYEPSLWESMLKKFHLCVYPIKELDAKCVLHFNGDDFIYRDIYLQNKHIGEFGYQRLLEINAFSDYKLEGVDTLFSHANQFIFVDNKYQVQILATERNEEKNIQMLPAFLATCNSKQIKGCWIEKCRKEEFIFREKEIGNILGLLNSVETLWVSNAMSLKSIFEIPEDIESEKQILEDAVFEKDTAEDVGLKKDITEEGPSEKEITKDGWSGKEISEDDWSEKEITEDGGSEKDSREDEEESLLEMPENGKLEKDIQDKESSFEMPKDDALQQEVPENKKESLFEMSENEKEVSVYNIESLFEMPEDGGSEKKVPEDRKESLFEMPKDGKESLFEMSETEKEVSVYNIESLFEIPEDGGSEKKVPEDRKESLFEMTKDEKESLFEMSENEKEVPIYNIESLFEIPEDGGSEKKVPEDRKESLFEMPKDEKESLFELPENENEVPVYNIESLFEMPDDGGSEKKVPEDRKESLFEMSENEKEVPDYNIESLFEMPEDGGSEKKVPEDRKESLFEMPKDEKESLFEMSEIEKGVPDYNIESLFEMPEDGGSEKEVPEDRKESLFEMPKDEKESLFEMSENEVEVLFEFSEDGGSEKEVPDDKRESLFEMGGSEKGVPEDKQESLFVVPEDGGLENEVPDYNLESLFEMPKDGGSEKKVPEDVLQNLEKLYLECCPKVSTVISLSQLPQKLKVLQIKFCDKLGKVFDKTVENSKLQYLETLHLWELPKLKSIGCELPSLKTLKISNCPNLQKLAETIRSAESLQNLWISNVRDLESIDISQELKYLSIDSCPNLLKISTLSLAPRELQIQIRFCNKLETVFEEGSASTIKLQNLHLHGLPKMKSLGATLQHQATCFIVDCLDFTINH